MLCFTELHWDVDNAAVFNFMNAFNLISAMERDKERKEFEKLQNSAGLVPAFIISIVFHRPNN